MCQQYTFNFDQTFKMISNSSQSEGLLTWVVYSSWKIKWNKYQIAIDSNLIVCILIKKIGIVLLNIEQFFSPFFPFLCYKTENPLFLYKNISNVWEVETEISGRAWNKNAKLQQLFLVLLI